MIEAKRLLHALRRCGALPLVLAVLGCSGNLDAGWDEPRGVLPVDDRNPYLLCNDGAYDDWQGEYAMLFASAGGPTLAGIIINDGWPWTSLDENVAGWQSMITAARNSGLRNIPEPTISIGPALVRPSSGAVEDTTPNQSQGARFIIEASRQWSKPYRPLVVITGGRLTDIADAYLIDPTLPERIVVLSSLGTANANGGEMGLPNGQLDSWADIIVAQKFHFIQVSTYYDAATDVPSSLLTQLPENEFTAWIAAKQPGVAYAYDQLSVQVLAMPELVTAAKKVTQRGESADGIPQLVENPEGTALVVSNVQHALATARFWELLLDPATFL